LPTPPSSPPRVGLHPVESTITLLENLVAFYHQERMWVYRTRAQLEMSLQDRDFSAAAAVDEEGEMEKEEPSSVEETSETSKWMKRKKAFGLKLEGIATTRGMPRGGIVKQRAPPPMESGVEILEMFERMMQARMESCERVTRMVRNASGT
ncbi:hypothetical protein BDR07DRAFT_1190864, partial [Suillus spraguei]